MMRPAVKKQLVVCVVLAAALVGASAEVRAQTWLQKPVTLTAQRKPLGTVLKELEARSGALFSYNSATLPADSLVSISVQGSTLNAALDKLLGDRYEYRERGAHVVIRPAADGGTYSVTGYVFDRETGERILYASVFEPRQLASTLTDHQGFFRLKLKDEYAAATLNIRHSYYADTSVPLRPGRDAEISVSIAPRPNEMDSIVVVPRNRFERFVARLLISPRLRMQDMNLGGFVAKQPVQFSIVPGLSTHGKMAAQIEDKVSINILGGYSGGVEGAQVGSLFNIVRRDVTGAQAGGLFNLVNGDVQGAQAAGIYNGTLGFVHGAQASGIASRVGRELHGTQTSGVYSEVLGDVRGVQASGVMSFARRSVRGVQLGGVANLALDTMQGTQLAGVINIARHSRGFQLGLINVADTSEGAMLGLLNVVRRGGVHEFSISSNEVVVLNASLKTGTPKLYTILTAGTTPGPEKLFAFGAGLGRKVRLGKHLSLVPEVSARNLYLGTWEEGPNLLSRGELMLSWRVAKGVQLMAGPSVSVYYTKQTREVEGFGFDIPRWSSYEFGRETRGWLGGAVGVAFF